MRIVGNKEFMDMPAGTIFAKYYNTGSFGVLQQKGETIRLYDGEAVDFYMKDLTTEIETNGTLEPQDKLYAAEKDSSIMLEVVFDIEGRDGHNDDGQLYVVWGKKDLKGLIEVLQEAHDKTNEI